MTKEIRSFGRFVNAHTTTKRHNAEGENPEITVTLIIYVSRYDLADDKKVEHCRINEEKEKEKKTLRNARNKNVKKTKKLGKYAKKYIK